MARDDTVKGPSDERNVDMMHRMDRWMAEIKYFDGTQQTVALDEIRDLHDLIELGPDWHTIGVIEIRLNRPALEPKRIASKEEL